jgi:hypothetical protein
MTRASSTEERLVPTFRRNSLSWPCVNRCSAIVQVLEKYGNFKYDYGTRPPLFFAPQQDGSGKTVFGKHFRDFFAMNKRFLRDKATCSSRLLSTLENSIFVTLNLGTSVLEKATSPIFL